MFHLPEARPVDYILSDVRPSHLSDGVFFHGAKPGPTHKCIAKQLTPVKRKPNDPVPPIAELESRVLERLAARGKAFYADTRTPGVDAWDLHVILRSLRENDKKFVTREGKQSQSAVIFPRLPRREYRCAMNKNRKIDDPEKLTSPRRRPLNLNGSARSEISRVIGSSNIDKPFWWKPEFPGEHCLPLPIASPNECSIDDLRGNIFEGSTVTKQNDENNSDDKIPRWRPLHRLTDLPKTEEERTKEMSEILKPYLHELYTWYSNNKFNI